MKDLIRRMFTERGFLNLTEESLQEELKANKDVDMDEDPLEKVDSKDVFGIEEENDDSISEDEKIQKLKMELSANIARALNETGLSLDLVSLLISSSKPNLAKSTISPHLSKNAPLGSFNIDRLTPEEGVTKKEDSTSKIGQGWKYESLEKVRDLFNTKSIELNQHIQNERTYWNTINKVLSNDEVLLKMRDPKDNSKAIGVKYGFGDSGSSYHDKGIALLSRDSKSGAVSFNPVLEADNKLVNKSFKYVRVKILSKVDNEYMLTGQSSFNFDINESSDKLISDIEKARFFIFEEDLFYHLTREARTLINYNVQIINDKIIIEINNEIIEIEAMQYEETSEDEIYNAPTGDSGKNNLRCQLILNYLKIMLCGFFKYNLKLKQKIPTKFTKFKQHNSHPLILRPLIGHIKHEAEITLLNNIISDIIVRYEDKIEAKTHVKKYENIQDLESISSPFIKSIERPRSKFTIISKNKSNSKYLQIDLDLTTSEIFVNSILHLKIIKFEKEEHLNTNEGGINVLKLTFDDFTDIGQCVDWSIQRFLYGD